VDEQNYGQLLSEIRPRVIDSVEEHERLLAVAERLMEKGDELTDEEREVLTLCVLLIQVFESHVLDTDDMDEEEAPTPNVALQRLMESHKMRVDDIVHIFGNPAAAKAALEGERPISRGQAKELGKFFRVPAKLFQE
jgi:HTH-type transcriptional regulator/antitoxin HigA